jgi:HlyD family secretion protein
MRQPSRYFIFLFLWSLLLVIGAGEGCGKANARVSDFETARISRGDIERRVIATGKIEPLSKVEIRSKVDGIIESMTVDEGDQVKKGQVIIVLDKEILASRVREARSALERAEASYQQAQIEASRSEADAAQRKYERAKKLSSQGLVPEQDMEDAETALTVAEENYRARLAAVSMAKAEVAALAATFDRVQKELKYATIVSPLNGIVLSRDVDVGSAVASVVSTMGTLLMTLGDAHEMHMVGDVDESDVGLVKEGMPARISVESFPDRKFQGAVKRISPLGVEKDRIMNFEVEIAIEKTDVALRSNMTADAEIIIENRHGVLLAPQNAIRYKREQAYVEAPDPADRSGKRAVDITPGISGTNSIEVLSGLKEGDEVIISSKESDESES